MREVGAGVRGKTSGRELSSIVLQYFELHVSAPFWRQMKTEVNVAEFSDGSPAKSSTDESSGHMYFF